MKTLHSAVACLLFSTAAIAQSAAASQQQISAVEARINQAFERHDTAAIDELVADDFRGVGASGRAITKADLRRAVATAEDGSTKASEESVSLHGDVALYFALITDIGKETIRTRVLDVWEKRPQGWRLIASHETRVKD